MADGFATRSIHAGRLPLPAEVPLAVPIWQTSTFVFDDAEHYAHTLRQPREGYVYTRYENPTTAALEATVANLEGAAEGMATASGMGAIATVLLSLAGSGDHVVAQRDLYGGSYSLLAHTAPASASRSASSTPATRPPSGPPCARPPGPSTPRRSPTRPSPWPTCPPWPRRPGGRGALVVDNTVATPYLCRPIEHGAAIVVHSATKYLGGHSDVVGGIAVFAEPERHDAAWRAMIELGASPDPFAAWLVLRGVKTLSLRMRAHGANARQLAELLDAHPKVARVYWPGLPGHPTADLAAKLLDGGPGMLSFDLAGGREAGRRFIEATRVAKLAASLGSVETLVSHPASTTHRQLSPDALAAAGIGEGMVRVSVGLEDGDDLAEDFTRALEVA